MNAGLAHHYTVTTRTEPGGRGQIGEALCACGDSVIPRARFNVGDTFDGDDTIPCPLKVQAENTRLRATYTTSPEVARAEERALIVTYIRFHDLDLLADKVEQGQHLTHNTQD